MDAICLSNDIWCVIFSYITKIKDIVSISETNANWNKLVDKSIQIIDDNEFTGTIPISFIDKLLPGLHIVIMRNSLFPDEVFTKILSIKTLEIQISSTALTLIWSHHYPNKESRRDITHNLIYRLNDGFMVEYRYADDNFSWCKL